MEKLLYIRHGQSELNNSNRFSGQGDAKLSETGVLQAQLLKDYVCKTYKVDKVYSSDLSRAYNTVKPIADYFNLDVTIDKKLREIDCGIWEGRLVDEVEKEYKEEFKVWNQTIGLGQPPKGENMTIVQQRGIKALNEILERNKGKTVVVGTHAGMIRAMHCYWLNVPVERMHQVPWAGNASVTEAFYEDGKLIHLNLGYNGYLGELATYIKK